MEILSSVGFFISPEGGLHVIVVEQCGVPGALLTVQTPACVSHSADFSLNSKVAQLLDYRKTGFNLSCQQ